jgi:hypothetical protein
MGSLRNKFGRLLPGGVVLFAALFGVRAISSPPVELPKTGGLDLVVRASGTPSPWKTWYGDAAVTNQRGRVSVVKRSSKDLAAYFLLRSPEIVAGHRYIVSGRALGQRGKFTYGTFAFYSSTSAPLTKTLLQERWTSENQSDWTTKPIVVPANAEYALFGVTRNSVKEFTIERLRLNDVTTPSELARLPKVKVTQVPTTVKATPPTVATTTTTTLPVLADLPPRSVLSLAKRRPKKPKYVWTTWYGDATVTARKDDVAVSLEPGIGTPKDAAASTILSVPSFRGGHKYQLRGELAWDSVSTVGSTVSSTSTPGVSAPDRRKRSFGLIRFLDGGAKPIGSDINLPIQIDTNDAKIAWQGAFPEGTQYAVLGVASTGSFRVTNLDLADISDDELVRAMSAKSVPSSVVPSSVVGGSPSTTSTTVVPIVLSENRVRSEVSLLERGAGVFAWKPWFGKSVVTVRSGVLTVSRSGGEKVGSAAVSVGGPVLVAGHRYRLLAEFDSSAGALGLVRSGASAVVFYDVKSRKLGEAGVLRPVGGSGTKLAWEGVAPEGAAFMVFGSYRTDAATWAMRGLNLVDISSDKEFPESNGPAGSTPSTGSTAPTSTVALPSELDDKKAVALPPLPAKTIPFTAASQSVLIPDESWKVWFGDPVVTGNPGAVEVSRSAGGPFGVFASVDALVLEPGITYRLKLRVERDEDVSVGGYIQIYSKDGSDLGERIPIVRVPGSTDESAVFTLPVGAQSFVVGVVQNGGDRFKILNNLLQRSV